MKGDAIFSNNIIKWKQMQTDQDWWQDKRETEDDENGPANRESHSLNI